MRPQSWYGEETLDVESVHTMAPGATIVYLGASCGSGPYGFFPTEALYDAIDKKLADIITNSWGLTEAFVDESEIQAENSQLMQAAAEGITVLFSSGDSGEPSSTGYASPLWPASSQYVTAGGGTSLALKNQTGEKEEWGWGTYDEELSNTQILDNGNLVIYTGTNGGWNFMWGSGGGTSMAIDQPAYQAKVVPYKMATTTYLFNGQPVPLYPPRRVTPDVAIVGDPSTGTLIGESCTMATTTVDPGCIATSKTTEYCERGGVGGTSLSSPLFAGVLARVDEERAANSLPLIGFANPALYALTPITGLGTPNMPSLIEALGH